MACRVRRLPKSFVNLLKLLRPLIDAMPMTSRQRCENVTQPTILRIRLKNRLPNGGNRCMLNIGYYACDADCPMWVIFLTPNHNVISAFYAISVIGTTFCLQFEFEYFPSYSPELNPVEQCWQYMKNVVLVNFVPKDNPELHARVLDAAQYINNDPKLLPAFFHHSKLRF